MTKKGRLTNMMKKVLSSLLAVLLVLGCCTAALAAESGAGVSVKTLETTIDSITVGIYTEAGAALKNGKIVFTYPETLKLVSAESMLPAEAGITDLDTAKTGAISFAWASVEAQGDTQLLELRFQGKCGASYGASLALPETGKSLDVALEIPYRFQDVQDAGKWYFAPVYEVYEAGLMNGVGGDRFAPDKTLNRAMLATVLYRMAGSPAVKGDSPFTDVGKNTWYTDAVVWASENGIVKGYGQGIFAPGRAISRQEMATMLFRFCKYQDGNVEAKASALEAYRDQNQVAGWALEAMQWAVTWGVMQGVSVYTLAPKNTATRAQVAQVLVNYRGMD